MKFYRLWIAGLLVVSGCAAKKPVQTPHTQVVVQCTAGCSAQTIEPVPGHPGYHYGPEHQECNAQNECVMVRSWLSDKDNKPVLTPLGCWLAKARITWIFGDKTSMCEQRPIN